MGKRQMVLAEILGQGSNPLLRPRLLSVRPNFQRPAGLIRQVPDSSDLRSGVRLGVARFKM